MKTTRPALALAIAASAVVLFAGCSSTGSDAPASTSASSSNDCDSLRSDVRDISNGAENTLAGDLSTTKDTATSYLADLTTRTGDLASTWSDDDDVSAAIVKLQTSLKDASDYVASVPTDGTEADSDAAASAGTAVSDAAVEVNSACK